MSVIDDVRYLLDFGKAHPDGFVNGDLLDVAGWPLKRFNRTVKALRLMCAEDDSINLICEPDGTGPWTYRLVGSLEGELWWRQNRQADTLTRLRTIWAVNHSLIAGTSGRTIEGKRVRMIDLALKHLLENIESLVDDTP